MRCPLRTPRAKRPWILLARYRTPKRAAPKMHAGGGYGAAAMSKKNEFCGCWIRGGLEVLRRAHDTLASKFLFYRACQGLLVGKAGLTIWIVVDRNYV